MISQATPFIFPRVHIQHSRRTRCSGQLVAGSGSVTAWKLAHGYRVPVWDERTRQDTFFLLPCEALTVGLPRDRAPIKFFITRYAWWDDMETVNVDAYKLCQRRLGNGCPRLPVPVIRFTSRWVSDEALIGWLLELISFHSG